MDWRGWWVMLCSQWANGGSPVAASPTRRLVRWCWMRVLCVAGTVAAVAACSPSAPFVCVTDSECRDADGQGRCEPDGFCSVPDSTCESGHRYVTLSGAERSGQCVAVAGTDSSSTGTAEDSTGVGSGTAASSSDGPSVDATGDSSSETSAVTSASSSGTSGVGAGSDSTTGAPVDPDLVAWYRLDALVGDGVLDSTPQGHHASCTDCPSEADGVIGGAMELDGMGQYFVVPYDPAFNVQNRTLCVWIWVESEPTEFLTIVGKPVGMANGNSWELGLNVGMTGTNVVAAWTDEMDFQGLSAPLPGIRQWVFVASTVSDETARLYIGETLVDEEPLAVLSTFDTSDVLIGADIDSQVVENFFHGRIDDLRIYDRALSAEELEAVMQGE